MMLTDHQEVEIRVVEIEPWGLVVAVEGEGEAFIDNTKVPSWRAASLLPEVGAMLAAVVLDASRSPVRLSALREDILIARSLRETGTE
jgi:hypothetical protein